ncbi:peptidoglycan/xylan/chitin deacetylase (PgdA/CDA1 family) [Actinoplanes octamycinicus]|uniref:Peptidoglycan/xylan/chitin deacetylase (PgdA/CDA1 family) n=1 Tax=Actinoplanes octamycinicus TaxID=135948 RepID=A0A7W7M7Y5_9ACTN|nr:polysaccharide deacetylase family protein [Actinoplanes octamycinicus]MBB4740313.1 peptidoglycan/xylan/chitin deacetylase (PgdA/CDA1 family) [Actinoplanes octamycinicus]GIE62611.1 hypothetical protein Aoc01nite_80130 [Actinoplanes octamycinicus]
MSDEPRVTPPGAATSDQTDAAPAEEATAVTPAADEPTVPMTPGDETTALIAAGDEATEPAAPEPTAAEPAADEETEAIPAGISADEATEAFPADGAADEATVAMTAQPAPDDATIALTGQPAADEATIALTAQPIVDEATVALTADPTIAQPPADPTIALTAQPPADATIALTAQPPADATVALTAQRTADATIALPTPPAATKPPAPPAAVPGQATPPRPASPGRPVLTRRRLLLGLSGVAGVAAAATAAAVHSSSSPSADGTAKPIPSQPTVVRSRVPESTTVTAPPLPVQRKPIKTLAEYAKATGKPAFPSDAIALTIDDGPHPVWTPKILKLLERYHVPALFCMIGNQVLGHETVAKLVIGDGHQLANHTWSHPTKLGKKPPALVEKEIHRAQHKINKTTGYVPKLFRSPGGDWSPQLLRGVAQAGLLPLDWSNDPRDWTRPGAAKIEHRMLAAGPGQILLCHDGGGDRSQTYQALSVVLPALKARGLQFVAL